MKKMLFVLLLCATFANAGPLDAVAPYVGGEWRIDAAWTGGEPLKGREIFTWSVGKKFIVCKTFVNTPKGDYQRYETIFGEQDGKLMAWSFVYDGELDVKEFAIDGARLHADRVLPAGDPNAGATLRQSIELTDPNTFRWIVSIEKDGKTDNIMDGKWIRSAAETKDAKIVWPKSEPTADDKLLDAITPLIGNWHVNAKWSDGRDLNAKHAFEWGPGKKFIVCKTALYKPDGSFDYDRYYTLFGVKGGKLTAFHFVFDGTTDFEPQDVNGKRISSARTFKSPEGDSVFHQFIEQTDPNTMHWQVWTDKDGADKPMMNADWKRDDSTK